MFKKILVTGTRGPHSLVAERFLEILKDNSLVFEHDEAGAISSFGAYDCVVDFAGFSNNADDYATDLTKTRKILRGLAKSKNLSRFVHIGSAAEYGQHTRPISEKVDSVPNNSYGKARLGQTKLIEKFARERGVKTINLRLFNIVGAPNSVFTHLMKEFGPRFNGVVQIANAKTQRDFVDVDDAARAVWYALSTQKGSVYELINISSGKGVSLGALAQMFGALCNRVFALEETSKSSDSSIGVATKAEKILGWKASTALKSSLKKLFVGHTRVLIVGAGEAAQKVIEEIRKEERSDIYVLGLVDDDVAKHGSVIDGVPVVGAISDVPRIVKKYAVEQILISTPSVQRAVLRNVVELLPKGFPVKVLPSISSVILGTVDLTNIRDIDLSDLIGRPLVKADQQRVAQAARGKVFLVTGAAGSIGSEVVRQLYHSGAKKIIAVDSWEEGVYNLLEEFNDSSYAHTGALVTYVANVRDVERLDEIVSKHRINVVIHAAAYKHVPLMEDNPSEAYKTNVQGTTNMLNLASRHGIKDFLLISTDKAVHPVNVMGDTKRQAELLLKEYAGKHPSNRLCAVRFGNVINSSGSVIPKFLKQIKRRAPVTVTHKDMTRYFMSIPEAVSLVLQAWIVAENGQILVLDMGEQIRIMDLAKTLIRLHGLEPGVDIEIHETGIRKGERLREELLYEAYTLTPTSIPRVFIAEELEQKKRARAAKKKILTRALKAKLPNTKASRAGKSLLVSGRGTPRR